MRPLHILAAALSLSAATLLPALAGTSDLKGPDGSPRGKVTVSAAPKGVVLKIEAKGLTPGWHGIHFHEKGDCSAPDAMSAGEHWNPTNKTHGQWGKESFHLGDIGNLKVGDDGRGSISMETDQWSLVPDAMDSVLGRSIVIHAQPDDFTTQPAGAAGARIGCGVVQKK